MPLLISLSYALNVAVLLPVCTFLLRQNAQFTQVFGPDTTARQILLSMYLTLLGLSLFFLATGNTNRTIAWTIFGFQIVYKLLTLGLVRDRRAPVYWFNLAIAVVHAVTLALNPLTAA